LVDEGRGLPCDFDETPIAQYGWRSVAALFLLFGALRLQGFETGRAKLTPLCLQTFHDLITVMLKLAT
jgi:hypothetical protein